MQVLMEEGTHEGDRGQDASVALHIRRKKRLVKHDAAFGMRTTKAVRIVPSEALANEAAQSLDVRDKLFVAAQVNMFMAQLRTEIKSGLA